MDIKKKYFKLVYKMALFIIFILLIALGSLTIASYYTHKNRVNNYYKSLTSDIARTVAGLLSDEYAGFLPLLLAEVKTPEYAALREEAIEKNDPSMIENWLKEKGFWKEYSSITNFLADFKRDMDILYLYVESDKEVNTIYLIDPDEGLLFLGETQESAKEFQDLVGDIHIDPVVSNGEYGWICSAYDPIYNSEGEALASVGVDLDMNLVRQEQLAFLYRMLIFAAAAMVCFSLLGMHLVRRTVIDPLEKLTRGLKEFVPTDDGDYDKSRVMSLNIQNKDEIGELYGDVKAMQKRIVDTLNNLTNITAAKERIETELNVATQIQADMLPGVFPAFPNRRDFDIFASMKPAKEVGGDFYDFFLVDEDHLAMIISDVSGKGVPAALFMVIAKTLIKNRAMMGDSPKQVLENVNAQLYEGNDAELFVTVWLAILELSTGKGIAANAGHEHPVLRRNNGQFELVVYRHSPAVAILEDVSFSEHTFELHPGDTLFVYTDGVPEATNDKDELFGTNRLLEALNKNPEADVEELLNNVKEAIDIFDGEEPQFDDITMLAMKYRGSEMQIPEGKNMKELDIEAKVENLDQVLAFVDGVLEEYACSIKAQMQIDIAVEEVFVNIASYAYAPGSGDARIQIMLKEPKKVFIRFIDQGVPFDPLEKPDPDVTLSAEERKIGGLGIYMVKKSMDEVSYEYKDGSNVLTIRKDLR